MSNPVNHRQLELKRTPFHERTSRLCLPQNWRRWAGYVVAGSYDLVLDREYWAIRDAAALIDITPLMKYIIEGPDAAKLLHRMTPRDIHKMAVGQVAYTGWCDDEGRMLDDGTISRLADDKFRMTSAEPSLRWLGMNAIGMDVTITEVTDKIAALSLQGPKSRTILNRICKKSLDKLKYFRFAENTLAGIPVTISRTGYTGDLGFEIWMDAGAALTVWDALIAAGNDYGIVPCGILAMDMARVEAGLFMIDVDYTATNHAWIAGQKSTPFELGLGWAVALDKPGYFVGRQALEREHKEGSAWRLVGLEVDWVGLEKLYAAVGLPPQIPAMAMRGSLPIMKDGKQVGYASTSTWSPVLKKYIALAHVQAPHFELGTQLAMEVTVEHHRRHASGTVVKLPFYEPEWKKK
jgi:aminomethyltransferase